MSYIKTKTTEKIILISLIIVFMWTSLDYGANKLTAYVPPIHDESTIENNLATASTISLQNYTMTTGYTYNWIDVSGGTELFLLDDGYSNQSLPFDFQFYNETFSTINVGANGYLSFTNPPPSGWINDPIPSGDLDNYYLIAPFWDDLRPYSGGGSGNITVQSFGTYWVAEWRNIIHWLGPLIGTFEVILYESGEIVFNYDYTSYTGGGYTCGLNLGVDVQYYNSYQGLNDLTDDFSILFNNHNLNVSLEVPIYSEIDNTYTINATVTNIATNDETGVNLFLYLDDVLVDSTTISSLAVGASETINYMWTPIEYGTYNFTAYAPPVSGESNIGDNIATELISILDTNLFEGMYINHTFDPSTSPASPSKFSYSYYSGSLFFEIWDVMGGSSSWYVDTQTRLMSGGSNFGNGYHTPAWIFTNVTLNDTILIAVDGAGDHLFNVSNELIYNLTSFGLIDVWVLEDLTLPGGVAWYEKSTGILLNGTFYYSGGTAWYTFDFVDTNVEFTYAVPPDDFILSSNAGTPDDDGIFDLTWTSADGALTYSVHQYSSYITEINGSLILLGAGITDLSLALSGYTDGTYYFIVVAHNNYGDTLSNCIEVVVGIPPGDFTLSSNAGTPDDNGAFDLSWTSAARTLNYSVYEYSGYINEINGSLTLLIEGTTDLSLALSAYTNGIYYFIVVAHNNYGDILSNCIEVVVLIPSVDGGIPGYNIYFIFAAIGVVSGVIIRKRRK